MDFSLSDEQRLLQDSVQKFIKGSYDVDTRRDTIKHKSSCNPAIWQQFAELGWLHLPFAEADGGLGGSLIDTMILLEEFGKGLVVEPYIASVVIGGGFLKHANAAQKKKYLDALMEGRLQIAFAVEEYEQCFDLGQTATRAQKEGNGFVIHGRKCVVLNGDKADVLVVLARTDTGIGQTQGLSLFLIDSSTPGIMIKPHRTVDGQQAAEIVFNAVFAGPETLLGAAGEAQGLAQTVINETILALGAEAVGALSVLLHSTVDYAKTRKQFGVPIGNFQTLQHRMANMFIAYEQTKSLLLAATLKVQEGHDDAQKAVHALKAQIGRGGRLVAQEAVQMHGGMGMTDELAIGHYFKRLTAIDAWFGNADQHIRAYGAA